jgi:hypothetical protein
MSTTENQRQSDQQEFDCWLGEAASGTISDEGLESLFRMILPPRPTLDIRMDTAKQRRLGTAINSYCHVIRIIRKYQDVDVDLKTARDLVAKRERAESFTNDEIRLLGKRSSDREADRLIDRAFWSVVNFISGPPLRQSAPFEVRPAQFYTTLSDEEFAILAESLLEQAVVHGTTSVSDRAWLAADASECPHAARKLFIAWGIGLTTERHDWKLLESKLSADEKAAEDRILSLLRHALSSPSSGNRRRASKAT